MTHHREENSKSESRNPKQFQNTKSKTNRSRYVWNFPLRILNLFRYSYFAFRISPTLVGPCRCRSLTHPTKTTNTFRESPFHHWPESDLIRPAASRFLPWSVSCVNTVRYISMALSRLLSFLSYRRAARRRASCCVAGFH